MESREEVAKRGRQCRQWSNLSPWWTGPSATLLACAVVACGSSSTSNDAGNNTNPSSAVAVSVPPSNQAQTVQIPQNSGPVTGSVTVPPVTVAGGATGDLTLKFLSGSNVAFNVAEPSGAPTTHRDSTDSLPGGPYIFELTVTAPFTFTLTGIPAFSLNLGSLGASNPNASYTIVAVVDGGPPVAFTLNAVDDTLSFPGVNESITIVAGTQLTVGILLSSNFSSPDAGPPDAGGVNPDAGPPVVFVVDSTATLYAFDAQGNVSAQVALPGTVGDLNGGEVTIVDDASAHYVFVTLGTPTNRFVAYTQVGLQPVALPDADYSALNVPRGIAFDSHNGALYVGNGGSTLTAYNVDGTDFSTPGGFPGHYGPSGVAYDPVDNTIWVANYVGNQGADFTIGTAEYNEDGSLTQGFNLSTEFLSPNTHTEPYSIAYSQDSTNGIKLAIGFFDDGSGQGSPTMALYALDGGFVTPGPTVTKPYQLSFDSLTYVWIADKSGLIQWGIGTPNIVPSGFTAVLKPPIYGVAAK